MATAVCCLRGRGAGMRSVGTVRFMRGVWVRLGIPRGFARAQFGMARAMIYRWGVIIAIGAPITQSHNSHNSHNSHIKRRPIDFANRNGYTEFECKKLP